MTQYIVTYTDSETIAKELMSNKDLLIEVLNDIGYEASQRDDYIQSLAKAFEDHDDASDATDFVYYLNKAIRDRDYDA